MLDWLLNNGDNKKLSYLDKMVVFLKKEYTIQVLKLTVCQVLTIKKIT
jgi:hypothetical protein